MKNSRAFSFLIFLFFFLQSCISEDSSAPVPRQRVELAVPEYRKIRPSIESFGTLLYEKKIEITAPQQGIVRSIGKKEGDSIQEGEVFLKLFNQKLVILEKKLQCSCSSAQAVCRQAEARYREGKREAERALLSIEKARLLLEEAEREREEAGRLLRNKKEIFGEGGISEESLNTLKMNYEKKESTCRLLEADIQMKEIGFRTKDILEAGLPYPVSSDQKKKLLIALNMESLQAEIDLAEAAFTISESELESVRQDIKNMEIQSPISGVIGGLYVCEGEKLAGESRIAAVFTADPISAEFTIPEISEGDITEGLDAEIEVEAAGNKVFAGTVTSVSPVIDPGSGKTRVKVLIDNSNLLLKPGMFFRVRVFLGQEQELCMLPKQCLCGQDSPDSRVFVVTKGRVFYRKVELGISREGFCQIVKGITAGEQVVINPPPELQDGEYVEI